MQGNYGKHAAIWDWGGHDNTDEHQHWLSWAKEYGDKVLIPTCALGETGAFMAERGMTVTAFDIEPEMIREGRKRFGDVKNLTFHIADARDFSFDIPPQDFAYSKDFPHLLTIADMKQSLARVAAHLRPGGCLVLEMGLPEKESRYSKPQTFHPVRDIYPGKKVWKTGDTRYDADTKRTTISQIVYIQDENGIETFDHTFVMQSYTRDEILEAFAETGYSIKGEYQNRDREPWTPENTWWIVETIRG